MTRCYEAWSKTVESCKSLKSGCGSLAVDEATIYEAIVSVSFGFGEMELETI